MRRYNSRIICQRNQRQAKCFCFLCASFPLLLYSSNDLIASSCIGPNEKLASATGVVVESDLPHSHRNTHTGFIIPARVHQSLDRLIVWRWICRSPWMPSAFCRLHFCADTHRCRHCKCFYLNTQKSVSLHCERSRGCFLKVSSSDTHAHTHYPP